LIATVELKPILNQDSNSDLNKMALRGIYGILFAQYVQFIRLT